MTNLIVNNISISSLEEQRYIQTQLRSFYRETLGLASETSTIPLNFVIKQNDKIIAGINANIYFILHKIGLNANY